MSSFPNNFGVVMSIVERPKQVEWCLQQIRAIYPEIPIIVISDGYDNPEYPGVTDRYATKLIKGEKLKRASSGGAWWARTLLHGLSMGTEYLLKIDPDTKFQRPIVSWPTSDIAGTLLQKGGA